MPRVPVGLPRRASLMPSGEEASSLIVRLMLDMGDKPRSWVWVDLHTGAVVERAVGLVEEHVKGQISQPGDKRDVPLPAHGPAVIGPLQE